MVQEEMVLAALLLDLGQQQDPTATVLLPHAASVLAEELQRSLRPTGLVSKSVPDEGHLAEVAADLAAEAAGRMIVAIDEGQRQAVARMVARAVDHGWSDETLGGRLKTIVGLDPVYEQAVQNYREGRVAAGDPSGKADRLAKAYATRLRSARALRIARTEVQRALNDGQRLIWNDLRDAGDISPYAVRQWVLHKDERLCKVCRPMNGKRASIGRDGGYNVPNVGSVVGPPIHPNCRCSEQLVDEGAVHVGV